MEEKYNGLVEAVKFGDVDGGLEEVRKLIDGGVQPVELFSQCIEPTLNELGEQFSKLEIFLPDLMVAGDVVNAIQEEVAPLLLAQDASVTKGIVVVATVYGDLHDIGKNMVSLMMQVNGFDMHDMGVDVAPVALVQKAEEVGADLLCLSGLMMPSMPFMRETIALVANNPKLAGKTKVLVGGGPVTQQWAEDNGAHGYADDAMGAVKEAYAVLGIDK
jgi:methanogenic corrinoid protein MtbC1